MVARPSATSVIALVALVLAVGGSAVADPGPANKITKSTVRKIAVKQINKAAPTLAVASAVNATNATNATNAVNATDAGHATTADTATTAATATNAASADNAALLDKLDSTEFRRGGLRTTTSSATPSVAGEGGLLLSYPLNTVVTDLTGGISGQLVTLQAGNSNVDIIDGSNFQLAGNASWLPGSGDTLLVFKGLGDLWWELARSDN